MLKPILFPPGIASESPAGVLGDGDNLQIQRVKLVLLAAAVCTVLELKT
jgi:hypothetical protein